MPTCPRCRSENVEVLDEDLSLIRCRACGYDGLEEGNSGNNSSEGRKSQREKGRYSPYKQGGKGRVQK